MFVWFSSSHEEGNSIISPSIGCVFSHGVEFCSYSLWLAWRLWEEQLTSYFQIWGLLGTLGLFSSISSSQCLSSLLCAQGFCQWDCIYCTAALRARIAVCTLVVVPWGTLCWDAHFETNGQKHPRICSFWQCCESYSKTCGGFSALGCCDALTWELCSPAPSVLPLGLGRAAQQVEVTWWKRSLWTAFLLPPIFLICCTNCF